ncbi:STY4528 family pathogenicity island replication protein [Saezia sanguinis]|uniref:STY4528 family pathogenicity island replication protein n=1 Tax=Saezia sanguinis TaxID=1965230 RepID=UPI00304BF79C
MTHAQSIHSKASPTLADLFEQAHALSAAPPTDDVFLFAGNRQESVPRTLFFDRRLTPIERNTWQIIKMLMESGSKTSMPTYDQLRPFLTAVPCATQASYETVAKAITLLRLTRWMTLVRRRRLPNGQVQSNIYVLHDEPLCPHETIQLDRDYFALVSKAMDHSSKAIRRIGELCFSEIVNDPTMGTKSLPTRLSVLTKRITETMEPENQKLSTENPASESEDSKMVSLRNRYGLTSESESRGKPAQSQTFTNPKSVRSSSIFNKKTTTEQKRVHIQLPERFKRLSPKQQNLALTAVQHLDIGIQQQIFIEWDRRCETMIIRKPPAYLLGIIQKALQGELNALNESPLTELQPLLKKSEVKQEAKPPQETPQEKEKSLMYIQQLREIVSKSKNTSFNGGKQV